MLVRVRRAHAALCGEALLIRADEVDDRDRSIHGAGHVRDHGVEVGDAGVAAEPVALDRRQARRIGDGRAGIGQVRRLDGAAHGRRRQLHTVMERRHIDTACEIERSDRR
jgi:hypothetical protein